MVYTSVLVLVDTLGVRIWKNNFFSLRENDHYKGPLCGRGRGRWRGTSPSGCPRLAPTSAFVTVIFDDKKRNSGDSVRVRGFHEDLCHTDTIMPGFSMTLYLNAVEVPM